MFAGNRGVDVSGGQGCARWPPPLAGRSDGRRVSAAWPRSWRKLIPTFVEAISLTVAALLPIMNPFSTAPLFVSLTANFEPRRRQAQA
ncbi:MAG TPA: hypothetical protein VGF50_05260, partial [Caulobacteraceae bacterium]